MNELITINSSTIDGQAVNTVNARDLHSFLEAKKDFSNWIKDRIEKYGFTENQDYVCSPVLASEGRGGQNRIDYHLSIDMAKELSMVERNEKGKQARLYFLECERRALAATLPSPKKPRTLSNQSADFRALKAMAITAGISGNAAIIAANNALKKLHAEDPLQLVGATHLISETQERVLTPTEIGQFLGGISARQVNQILEKTGLQKKDAAGWVPTENGKPLAVLLDTGKKHSSGTMVHQLKWKETVVHVLGETANA